MARVELKGDEKNHRVDSTSASVVLTKMLGRFKRKVRAERLLQEMDERKSYVKPSDKKRGWVRPK